MRINYFSDIHLEFGAVGLPDTDAELIIAAGDIGIYDQGLEWLKQAPVPVVYVAGNHEFYHHEYFDTLKMLRRSAEGSQVHFLENDCWVMEGLRVLGCTLWTELGGEENDCIDTLSQTVNDFRKIRHGQGKMEWRTYRQMHQESRHWLMMELEKPFAGKTVVVSHHAPTVWSWNKSHKSLTRFAYCNDLKELMHRYDIDAWVHGHTHTVSNYRCAGTQILCNPRGYSGRQVVAGFDLAKVIDL